MPHLRTGDGKRSETGTVFDKGMMDLKHSRGEQAGRSGMDHGSYWTPLCFTVAGLIRTREF